MKKRRCIATSLHKTNNILYEEFRTQKQSRRLGKLRSEFSMNSVRVGDEYWLKASGIVGEKN
jgi:hypothetical protein